MNFSLLSKQVTCDNSAFCVARRSCAVETLNGSSVVDFSLHSFLIITVSYSHTESPALSRWHPQFNLVIRSPAQSIIHGR